MYLSTFDTNIDEWYHHDTKFTNSLDGLVGYIEEANHPSELKTGGCPLGLYRHRILKKHNEKLAVVQDIMIGDCLWIAGRQLQHIYIILSPTKLTDKKARVILDEAFQDHVDSEDEIA